MVLKEGPRSIEIPSSRIGTATIIPEYNLTNEEMADYFKQIGVTTGHGNHVTPQGIEELTGIVSRHLVNELGAQKIEERSDVIPFMATEASIRAIKARELKGVDVILTSTTFPYRKSLKFELIESLDLNCRYSVHTDEAVGGDIYAACTGSAWAFHYLRERHDQMLGKRVLIVASEYISPTLNDLNSSLFSDGAAALAFVYGEDLEVLASNAKVFAGTERYIRFPIYKENLPYENVLHFVPTAIPDESQEFNREKNLHMRYGQLEGPQILSWAVKTVPQMIYESVKKSDVVPDWVILHQANERITEHFRTRLPQIGINAQVISNIKNHGNTSSASILIAMDEARKEGLIGRGSIGVLAGFGAGMSAVVAVLKIK